VNPANEQRAGLLRGLGGIPCQRGDLVACHGPPPSRYVARHLGM